MFCRTPVRADTAANFDSAHASNDSIDAVASAGEVTIRHSLT
jgi:hypothetical protein